LKDNERHSPAERRADQDPGERDNERRENEHRGVKARLADRGNGCFERRTTPGGSFEKKGTGQSGNKDEKPQDEKSRLGSQAGNTLGLQVVVTEKNLVIKKRHAGRTEKKSEDLR